MQILWRDTRFCFLWFVFVFSPMFFSVLSLVVCTSRARGSLERLLRNALVYVERHIKAARSLTFHPQTFLPMQLTDRTTSDLQQISSRTTANLLTLNSKKHRIFLFLTHSYINSLSHMCCWVCNFFHLLCVSLTVIFAYCTETVLFSTSFSRYIGWINVVWKMRFIPSRYNNCSSTAFLININIITSSGADPKGALPAPPAPLFPGGKRFHSLNCTNLISWLSGKLLKLLS